ncbi:helix-turn-helix domain-containing protein [Aeromicrobium sp. UC242_57]|uniref:helix-turn-helix domain-containing protein n=1 Tax=Aeromicrobium sp. UC242_57 TaxID=3374624 RepID=UPI0037B89F72
MFADRSYEDVHIEELAEVAGVSRGLLYHYFPNKRAFFAAMVSRESGRMAELTSPDSDAPVVDQRATASRPTSTTARPTRPASRRCFAALHRPTPRSRPSSTRTSASRLPASSRPSARHSRPSCWSSRCAAGVQLLRNISLEWLDTKDVGRDEVRDLVITMLTSTLPAQP